MRGFSFAGLDALILIPWELNPLVLNPRHLNPWDFDAWV